MTRGTDAQSYFTEAALFDKNRNKLQHTAYKRVNRRHDTM